jgi:hypothetical protein
LLLPEKDSLQDLKTQQAYYGGNNSWMPPDGYDRQAEAIGQVIPEYTKEHKAKIVLPGIIGE